MICSLHPVSRIKTCSAAVVQYCVELLYSCAPRFEKPTPRLVPHTVSIAPTKSHTERYLSSSHPDRCLYAMLAFIVGYAWSRMLCATAVRLRTVVCVSCFRFFCSYLALSASDRPPLQLLYTYTQQQILTPSVISSLPSEAFPRVTRMDPSPPSASGTYLSVIFFSTAYLSDTCSCDMIYLHREEIPRYIVVNPSDWDWEMLSTVIAAI